jgi:hypothetical protein
VKEPAAWPQTVTWLEQEEMAMLEVGVLVFFMAVEVEIIISAGAGAPFALSGPVINANSPQQEQEMNKEILCGSTQ